MKKLALNILVIILLISCGEDDQPATPSDPKATSLLFPEKDSGCTQGTNLANSKSTLVFKWNKSAFTDTYELVLKNLKSGKITNHPSTTNQLSLELATGTPYSWYVISKATSVIKTGISETWKFYNAGEGVVYYAPFPAEVVYPINRTTVPSTADKIFLAWNATDVDNDIDSYDLYFGTEITPPSFQTGIKGNVLTAIPVSSGSTYYWYVITNDKQGNNSKSETFTFSIN